MVEKAREEGLALQAVDSENREEAAGARVDFPEAVWVDLETRTECSKGLQLRCRFRRSTRTFRHWL
jgi:hypothetical protein